MGDDQESGAMMDWTAEDDGRTGLAVAAGMAAAFVGGLIWAAIAIIGNLEIGWAAWGIGALVGWAMCRVTTKRARSLQFTAALLAATGLVMGKAFNVMGSTRAMTEEIKGTPELLTGAVAWKLYDERALDASTLDSVDATHARDDTLSDVLWQQMTTQAAARLPSMTEAEKQQAARFIAESTVSQLGLFRGIVQQLSPWDALWFGLALATAYRMLGPHKEAPAEQQPESE